MAGTSSQATVREPILSVVLPNYNHARYLPRALDALLNQNSAATEILVIDDCSTDASRSIITDYAAKHPSIRLLVNKKNVGAIETLARGLQAARGQFVYFGAADDYVMPGFFSTAIEMLIAHSQAGLFCGEAILVDGITNRKIGIRPPVRPRFSSGFIPPAKFAALLERNDNFMVTGAAVFRHDAAAWSGGFDRCLSSFADGYMIRKVALTFGLCYAPQICLTWCAFPDSVSRKTASDAERTLQVLTTIQERMASDPVFPKWYRDKFTLRWRFSACRLALQQEPPNRDFLVEVGPHRRRDHVVYDFALNTFSSAFARFTILSWLWLQFRPFSLIGLVSTALARRLGFR